MKKSVCFLLSLVVFLSFFPLVFAAVPPVSVIVEFANGGSCYMTGNSSAWLTTNGQVSNWTVKNGQSSGDCFFPNPDGGFMDSSDDGNTSCCPSGWNACTHDIGSVSYAGGRCVEKVQLCSNLGNEGGCKSATQDVAERTLGTRENFTQYLDKNGGICYSYSSAKCVWDNSSKDNQSCVASLVNITGINDTVRGNCTLSQTLSTCIYQFAGQKDNCDTAAQTITINYTAVAKLVNGSLVDPASQNMSGWCQAKSEDYACSASIQLPGFSLFNFLVSILGIGMVYFLFKENFKEKA